MMCAQCAEDYHHALNVQLLATFALDYGAGGHASIYFDALIIISTWDEICPASAQWGE